MLYLYEEKKLWKRGYKVVVGLDEVGRGALAGPVFAGAVVIKDPAFFKVSQLNFKDLKIKDSKQLTPQKREKLYKILTNHPQLIWGIGKSYPKTIDKINILEATKLAMKKALIQISNRLGKDKISFLILDGKMNLGLNIPQKSIIKADEKVLSCAIASIIAKVKRDKTMLSYHKKYPQYLFSQNKGYGTKKHIQILKKIGPCVIHRNSFNYYGNS